VKLKELFKIAGIFCFSIVVLFCGPDTGYSEEDEGKDHVYAIQSRIFDRSHELDLILGYIPDDDFYNAYPIGLSYIFHFNENFAWEVLRGQWVINKERDIKTDLETNFGVTPERFDSIKYLAHTHLIFKPNYGKDAILNRSIINHEGYLFIGGGVVGYERKYSNGDIATETAPSISLGFGRKYFLSKSLSMNLELRDLINLKEEGVENNVLLGITIGFRFDLSPRKTAMDSTIERLNNYLKNDNENEN